MDSAEFIKLMRYPPQWCEWGLLPAEFVTAQMSHYEPGNENASEHFRNEAFFYWLKQNPSKEVLIQLVKLAALDPDKPMGRWLQNECIAKAENADSEVHEVVRGYST